MIANKYKILVIEDEDNINNLLKALLETYGYQVITAKNCQNGIPCLPHTGRIW